MEPLNTSPGIHLNIFFDVTVTCSAYLEAISLYAVHGGRLWLDLWQQTSAETYRLNNSIMLEVISGGLHTFLTPSGAQKIYVEQGMIVGVHYDSSQSGGGVVFYAQHLNGEENTSGYSISQLSRFTTTGIFNGDLIVGNELIATPYSYVKRIPAINLHFGPGNLISLI